MAGKFIISNQAKRDQLDWGELGWMTPPDTTGARQLAVLEVTLLPGQGHNFHKHPKQEEAIYVIEGTVEQWLEQQKQMLQPGDVVFIPADTVHASFNTGDQAIKLLAVLGPCVGEAGYELEDVSGQAPWNTIR